MKWLVLASLIAANLLELPAPVIKIESGLVRGIISNNARFYQYFGIPYGSVTQENRFQAPLPPPKWKGIFEAVNENIRCPQMALDFMVIGEPDCLKLNIYVPVTASPQYPVPVMVYIHGGCFFEGTGAPLLYGGDYFAENGVVLVTVSYRLNVEGFLCLGIKKAPGNAGLKDQIAALKWVKRNIKAFGGDPDNVTVFGESAGAVSTSFLILAPSARDLFHKVILQSGSTLSPWSIQHDPIATASSLVKEFGYNTKDPHKIYNILRRKNFKDILHAIKNPENKNYITAENLFVPCIEKDIPGIDPVITVYPADIISAGNYSKVPMIIGHTDKEGSFFVAKDFGISLNNIDDITTRFKPDLIFPNDAEKKITEETIRKFYFSDNTEIYMGMVNLYSDLFFKFPAVVESELYAKTTDQPIYYYLFKYNGLMNLPKIISRSILMNGATHADDLFYLFKPHSIPILWKDLEMDMIKRMVTLWTNFAKYSDPTPKKMNPLPLRWRPSRNWNPEALVIDKKFRKAPLWDLSAVKLWNETYSKYRRKSYGFH